MPIVTNIIAINELREWWPREWGLDLKGGVSTVTNEDVDSSKRVVLRLVSSRSLLKFTDTRASNKKMTSMHYFDKVLAAKSPALLDFHVDLVSLEAVTKVLRLVSSRSLLKFTDTRASNKKMTSMHYFDKVLAAKSPALLDFHVDLVSLEAVTKSLAEEMQAIIKGLEKVKQELTASTYDGPVSEVFHKTLNAFIGFAESDVTYVTSLYTVVGRNADLLDLYFNEDLAHFPFEQVTRTLLNFVRLFRKAHEENYKQAELKKENAQKEIAAPRLSGKHSFNTKVNLDGVENQKGYNNSKDRLLPKESRMESENGDVEVDAFKDYALVDENKRSDTRILNVDRVIGGLKPTVVAANEDGNMKDGKEVKLEDVKSKQGTDEDVMKKSSRKNSSNKGSMLRPKEWQRLVISLKEIQVATKNFQECIGKGGYGFVYKGKLNKSAGRSVLVAIKRLNTQFGQGLKEFLTEIHLLSGKKHPNLISLLGYCEEDKEKILVYEYAQRGSLDQYLRRNNTTNYTLTWLQRLKICVGAARGLDHIHYHVGKHLTIIHRDVKNANILLDQNFVAKISDFGLSKLSFAGLDKSTVISNVCGTLGYCEPECMITGMLQKESDVYSFGMVLFEVFCGRLCTVKDNDYILLSGPLAREFYDKKRLEEIIDPSLKEHLNSDSLNKFSEIAYRCLHYDRMQRPPMDLVLVVKELEDLLKIQEEMIRLRDLGANTPTVRSDESQHEVGEGSGSGGGGDNEPGADEDAGGDGEI
nr:serine-threonine/tyrosine-protein kinase catalytic domain-containing protein [Tanacetum cinerariifolium]